MKKRWKGYPFDNPWPSLLAERLSCEVINLGENDAEIPHSESIIMLRIRTTYLFDENGVIVQAKAKIKAADNPQKMLELL